MGYASDIEYQGISRNIAQVQCFHPSVVHRSVQHCTVYMLGLLLYTNSPVAVKACLDLATLVAINGDIVYGHLCLIYGLCIRIRINRTIKTEPKKHDKLCISLNIIMENNREWRQLRTFAFPSMYSTCATYKYLLYIHVQLVLYVCNMYFTYAHCRSTDQREQRVDIGPGARPCPAGWRGFCRLGGEGKDIYIH